MIIPNQINPSRVKVRFKLIQDADGYPPATAEFVWALPIGNRCYQIDNVPFFVTGVSCYDIITALDNADGVLSFESLYEEKGHSTLRVILFEKSNRVGESLESRSMELRNALKTKGCTTEQSHISGLLSIDVPSEVDLSEIRSFLKKGAEKGRWDYEEATIARVKTEPRDR